MRKFQKLFILWIILFTSTLSAQYTGVINSNRPGFSESPYSVGTGIYQLETSLFFRKTGIYPTFSKPQSSGVDLLFRTSFFKEKLELNANFAFQKDKIAFENIFTSSYFTSGLSKLTIAGKYLVYEQKYKDKSKEIRSWTERHRFDWKRVIPSVAVYAGLNTDFVGEVHKVGQISPKVGVLLQNDLTRDLNIITNIFYDKIGTDFSEISYIITGTYSFNERWSTFIENQTFFNKFENRTSLGSGLAFLYNRDIQVNSSLRLLVNGKSSGFYTSFGVSYRLDRHKDKVTELDESGNPIVEEKEESIKKKGFFGRLFGKITGIFKKKGSQPTVKLKEKTIESIRKNTNKDELTINNDTLKKIEKPIRTRPVRKRVKPTKIKSVKKKGKGGIFSIFKKKDSVEKDRARKEKAKRQKEKQLERDKKREAAQKKKDEARKKKEEAKKKKEEAKKKKDEQKNGGGNN
ncbi:MAG: transporter [Flavobacteriaceae bacterium]